MKQAKATGKALRSIKIQLSANLIADDWLIIFTHLKNIYAVGYEEGKSQLKHRKRVIQIENGIIIDDFPSALVAANHMRVTESTMSKALNLKRKNGNPRLCKGFEFKYKIETI